MYSSLQWNVTDIECYILHKVVCFVSVSAVWFLVSEQLTVRIDWPAVFIFPSGVYCASVRVLVCVCIAVISIESCMEL
jgi:hypothetical protein